MFHNFLILFGKQNLRRKSNVLWLWGWCNSWILEEKDEYYKGLFRSLKCLCTLIRTANLEKESPCSFQTKGTTGEAQSSWSLQSWWRGDQKEYFCDRKPSLGIYSPRPVKSGHNLSFKQCFSFKLLGWPKSLFGFFHNILPKKPEWTFQLTQ